MSPILVRPVREQLEHDRVIRLLQAKYRRKYDAGINPGNEQNAPVGSGASIRFPDLVLHSTERGRRLQGVVEVETGESVNHLEALAQWAQFSQLRVPLHLYVPSGMVEVARRLCDDNSIRVAETWSYHTIADDVRFTLVHRSRDSHAPAQKPRPSTPAARRPVPVSRRASKPVARSKAARKPVRARRK